MRIHLADGSRGYERYGRNRRATGLAEYRRHHMHTGGATTPVDVMRATKTPAHVHDARESEAYRMGNPNAVAGVDLGGARTVLYVPMLKENEIIGVINVYRQEVRPFADEQIALLKNFAAQAVIAIENTRILSELRQRTDDLAELLDQQTATSKVLEVISRSVFDLQAVFEAVVESSVRLCNADKGFIFRFDGELLRLTATYNATPEFEEWVAQHPIQPGRHSAGARAALERRTIHIPDALADPEYSYGVGQTGVKAFRTLLGVPILKGDELLGVIIIYHLEVRPFTRIGDAEGVSLILILSDINMPGMTGLELLPKAKALRPDVPVIMITAYGDEETKRRALNGGAETLLTKPIDFAALRTEIDTRVERVA